jgi:hypothetical protein
MKVIAGHEHRLSFASSAAKMVYLVGYDHSCASTTAKNP